MAEENVPQLPPQSGVSHEGLNQQAHYQIEAICNALLKAAQSQYTDHLQFLVQSMVIRIDTLNSAMMNAADGSASNVKDLRYAVLGTFAQDSNGVLQ